MTEVLASYCYGQLLKVPTWLNGEKHCIFGGPNTREFTFKAVKEENCGVGVLAVLASPGVWLR